MKNQINNSNYRAHYESNPSRAARLLEALVSRLKNADDPDLSRKILTNLADALDIPITIDEVNQKPGLMDFTMV